MTTISFLFAALFTIVLYLGATGIYYFNKITDQKEQIARLEKLANSLAKKLRENNRKIIKGFGG